MSKILSFPPRDERYEEASQWVARLDKGLTANETEALQLWMAADPENAEILMSMTEMWDKMDSLSRLAELFPLPERRPKRSWGPNFRVAASVLLVLLGGIWAFAEFRPPGSWQRQADSVAHAFEQTYRTAVGEQQAVTLPDGTAVHLNTDSILRVAYTADQRLLTLERGEVNLRVARDESRLLSVMAGGQVVQAIGTEFNVEIKDDQKIELVVTEGRVRVGVRPQALDSRAQDMVRDFSDSLLIVSAGEELLLGAPVQEVKPMSPEDIEVKLAWRHGNLILRGESLEEAVGEIGRYTSVEFIFLDESLRKIRVAGRFKAGDVDGLLVTLREHFDIVYERVGDQTVYLDSE